MNIQEIVTILTNSGIHPREANIEVRMMIEHYCNYTAMDIIRGVALDYEKLKIVKEKALLRAKTRIPVQYIMGHAYFMGQKFKVNEKVLIPRGDTEHVVARAIDIINSYSYKNILDIGTGSGCISCMIAQKTEANVTAIDISEDALNIARENAKQFKLEKQINFVQSNLFENIKNKKFDLIISNPPYIAQGTRLPQEVQHEPTSALFADDNGLYFYKQIISQAHNYLNPQGHIVFEIGYNQALEVSDILAKNQFKDIMVEKDMAGLDRIVYAKLA